MGTDTFVDFDKGSNLCVAQIRTALHDEASRPIYIRTIPKQGYEFIAPVQRSLLPGHRHRRPWRCSIEALRSEMQVDIRYAKRSST